MKVRILAVAVFRYVAACSSGSGEPSAVSQIIADVSVDSPEGALVDRKKLDEAVALLLRTMLVEAEEECLVLTAEGKHFWRRISHLPPPGMKKWIREAVDTYSRGEDLQWATPEKAWSDAQILFLERHRSRMTARLEVLDGILRAVDNWHFVSSLVGAAADRYAAVAALQGFPFLFSKVQANQIVDMRLIQRTALGRLSLAEERDAIRAQLEELPEEPTKDEPSRDEPPKDPDPLAWSSLSPE